MMELGKLLVLEGRKAREVDRWMDGVAVQILYLLFFSLLQMTYVYTRLSSFLYTDINTQPAVHLSTSHKLLSNNKNLHFTCNKHNPAKVINTQVIQKGGYQKVITFLISQAPSVETKVDITKRSHRLLACLICISLSARPEKMPKKTQDRQNTSPCGIELMAFILQAADGALDGIKFYDYTAFLGNLGSFYLASLAVVVSRPLLCRNRIMFGWDRKLFDPLAHLGSWLREFVGLVIQNALVNSVACLLA